MAGKKGNFGRRRNIKCAKCGKTFSNNRYLLQHQEAKHNNIIMNNNNNNNKKYKNKNLFKKFINFIMKLITLINNEIEIKNYIGDKFERQKAMSDLINDVPDTKIIKKLEIIKDGPSDVEDDFIDDMTKEDKKLFSDIWGSDIDKKVAELRRIERIKKTIKEKKEKRENKKYEKIYNFLKEFDNTPINKTKYDDIKIKRNIIETIKNQKKEKIENAVKRKIEEDIEKEIKIEEKQQPIVEYEADFLYPKISARELFIKSFPDKKMKDFAIYYINKHYNDYPTDDEIKEFGEIIYGHYTRVLSGNGYYAKKYDELREKLLEYYDNGGESFRCEYCKKYVSCKRRHCLHCIFFLKELDNDPKQLKLKKYLENNYKKVKIEEINLILEHFKGKNSEFIKKYLPGYIKFKKNIRKKWLKKQQRKHELTEKAGVEISMIPPIHFNTGLAKKLFAEVTNFDN